MLLVKLKTHFSPSFSSSNCVPYGFRGNSQCPEASNRGNLKRVDNLFILVTDGRPRTAKPMKCCFLWIRVLSPLTTTSSDIFPQPFDVCHRHRVDQQELIQGHRGLVSMGSSASQLLHPERATELNCVVMTGELVRTSAITLPCASRLKIVWKRRQTSQLSEEPHFLKLPSTDTSRSGRTEALEASQWCQASASASLANSSWCQQRNKALFNWGWSRVETVPPCCRAVPKRCSGDHSDNSKGTRLEGMC